MKTVTFEPLAKILTPEQYDEIGAIFDRERHVDAGDNQWKLTGLMVFLDCVKNWPDDNTTLSVPMLRTLQALEAAYSIGFAAGAQSITPPSPAATNPRPPADR